MASIFVTLKVTNCDFTQKLWLRAPLSPWPSAFGPLSPWAPRPLQPFGPSALWPLGPLAPQPSALGPLGPRAPRPFGPSALWPLIPPPLGPRPPQPLALGPLGPLAPWPSGPSALGPLGPQPPRAPGHGPGVPCGIHPCAQARLPEAPASISIPLERCGPQTSSAAVSLEAI
ncbi:unnamed protein product [Boreogadus saida]